VQVVVSALSPNFGLIEFTILDTVRFSYLGIIHSFIDSSFITHVAAHKIHKYTDITNE